MHGQERAGHLYYADMLHADGHDGPLEPWDWRYYAEARRRAEHEIDDGTLKPYLQLDRMIEAAFSGAHRAMTARRRAWTPRVRLPTPTRKRTPKVVRSQAGIPQHVTSRLPHR